MKTFLILSLACVMFGASQTGAHAILANWQPCERAQAGELGSGAHREVKGMLIYSTPPSKPYVVIGLIDAGSGMFGSPRTRAVALARKVGADALIMLSSDRFVTGTSTSFSGTGYSNALGNSSYGSVVGNGHSHVNYAVIGHYAAIKWTAQDSASASPLLPVASTANPR